MTRKELKQLIREVIEEASGSQWEVSFFDEHGAHYTIITAAKTKEKAIENAKKFSCETGLEDWEREIFNRAVKVRAVKVKAKLSK